MFSQKWASVDELKALREKMSDKIKRAREKSGISQAELARRLGVTQPLISRIEKGENLPREETLSRIAGALNLDPGHFTGKPSASDQWGDSTFPDLLTKMNDQMDEIHRAVDDLRKSSILSDSLSEVSKIRITANGEIETEGPITLPREITGGATHFLQIQSDHLEPFILKDEILLLQWKVSSAKDGQLSLIETPDGHQVGFVFTDGHMTGIGRSRSEALWIKTSTVRFRAAVTGRISPVSVIDTIEKWATDH